MTSLRYGNRYSISLGMAYLVAALPSAQQSAAARRLLSSLKSSLAQVERGRLGVSPLDWLAGTRHAALPFDRDELDTLFAAAALGNNVTGPYIVRNQDSPLGLGYVHLGAARYVSTLADVAKDSPTVLREVLSLGSREAAVRHVRELLLTPPAIELEDESPTLYALCLPEHQAQSLGRELGREPGRRGKAGIRLQLFEGNNEARRFPSAPDKFRPTVTLGLRALSSTRFAIEGATPEWLLECHAGAMDCLWAGIEGHGFSLVVRLPDPSGTEGRQEAAGFHFPFALEAALGIPAEWRAPVPTDIALALATDYPWFSHEHMADWVKAIQSRRPDCAL